MTFPMHSMTWLPSVLIPEFSNNAQDKEFFCSAKMQSSHDGEKICCRQNNAICGGHFVTETISLPNVKGTKCAMWKSDIYLWCQPSPGRQGGSTLGSTIKNLIFMNVRRNRIIPHAITLLFPLFCHLWYTYPLPLRTAQWRGVAWPAVWCNATKKRAENGEMEARRSWDARMASATQWFEEEIVGPN